ncbi:MAG: hypothetical protein ACNS63_01035 [Candidatus Nitrospinota bacterium M3_3B_026]
MILSDIRYHIVFVIVLDPPMTKRMEEPLPGIFREEAESMGLALDSLTMEKTHHAAAVAAPADRAPAAIAGGLRENVSRRVIFRFGDELSGWGSIYGGPMMIKSGRRPSRARIEAFLRLALGGT